MIQKLSMIKLQKLENVSKNFRNKIDIYMDCYILLTVLLVILLFIIAVVFYHYVKHSYRKTKNHIIVLKVLKWAIRNF